VSVSLAIAWHTFDVVHMLTFCRDRPPEERPEPALLLEGSDAPSPLPTAPPASFGPPGSSGPRYVFLCDECALETDMSLNESRRFCECDSRRRL